MQILTCFWGVEQGFHFGLKSSFQDAAFSVIHLGFLFAPNHLGFHGFCRCLSVPGVLEVSRLKHRKKIGNFSFQSLGLQNFFQAFPRKMTPGSACVQVPVHEGF